MHQALAAERDEAGLRVTPPGQRGSPLLGPAQVEDLLAGLDDSAVDDPGDNRGHLSRRHRHHGLVQEGHAVGDLAQRDETLAPPKPGQRRQIRVPEPVADRTGLFEDRERGGGVSLHEGLERRRDHREPLLDAIELRFLQQPAAPGDPAPAAGHLASIDQPHPRPEGASNRPRYVAPAHVLVVRAGPRFRAGFVLARQVGGHGQPFEIRRLQRRASVRRR